jgi:hypothetical protein
MSEEVAQEEVAEEAVETTDALTAALAEMQAQLDGAPETEEETKTEPEAEEAEGDEPETEQQPGVEQSAATDSGAPAGAEGPSFLMKRVAEQSGVDPKLIALAVNDAQLEQMIEVTTKREADTTETDAPAPTFELKVELPEDEFPADDPVRKHLETWKEQLTKQFEEHAKGLQAMAAFANEELDRRDREAQEAQFSEYSKLASPFDEYLDSFASDVLGTAESCKTNEKQRAARVAVWERYNGLGAKPTLDKETLTRKAALAMQDFNPDLVEQRNQKQQTAAKQSKTVLGGSASKRSPSPKPSEAQALREWQDMIEGKTPLNV